jgi:hypothetical protein
MRIEIIIFLITGFLIGNIYTEGKILKNLFSYKKYYQMAGIAFGGVMAFWLLKKNPHKANEMFAASHEYLKYLPVDQNTSSIISPILDFTSKQNFSGNLSSNERTANGGSYNIMNMLIPGQNNVQEERLMNSGKTGTKRSVSETKKKFVASRQNWKCGDCNETLSAWFEVDHKLRLEYGGSNHIDNLVALCRECHGKKTTIENL